MTANRPPSTVSPSSNAPRCYLVTGAAGFIASKVCEMLLAEGHTVVGVDNLNDYYDVRLKDYRLSRLLGAGSWEPGADPKKSIYLPKPETGNLKPEISEPTLISPSTSGFRSQVSGITHGNFTFHVLDIENLKDLDALFATRKFEAVFNLAARAGVRYSMENPYVYLSTNTLGTLNILECMRKYGVKQQVLASTSSLYAGCPMPFTEDQPVNTPLSPYAASKKAAEMMAYSYYKLYGINTTVVRYFTVFGPAGRPDMAPFRFVHWVATGQPIKLFGDGNQSRDFTYVDDIARGTILAAKPLGYEVINLGGGNRPITINAMIELIERELNEQTKQKTETGELKPEGSEGNSGLRSQGSGLSSLPYKAKINRQPVNPVDMTDTQADIAKAGRLLGWKPQVSPESGFEESVRWYVENGDWLKSISV